MVERDRRELFGNYVCELMSSPVVSWQIVWLCNCNKMRSCLWRNWPHACYILCLFVRCVQQTQ